MKTIILNLILGIILIFLFGNIIAELIGFVSEALGYKILTMILEADTTLPILFSDYELSKTSFFVESAAWFFTAVILFAPFIVSIKNT